MTNPGVSRDDPWVRTANQRSQLSAGRHLLLYETIGLGKLLDRLPNGLVLIGIEAIDFNNGEGMSEAVTAGVLAAAEAVLAEVAS